VNVQEEFELLKARNLSIDATRGKPCAEQLALSNKLFNMPLSPSPYAEDGTDVRNYGGNDGLPEMKRIFAELLDVEAGEIIVGGNSSLNMMFDCISTMVLSRQWNNPKFICPAPGYDRHFAICEYFGIKMLTVKTNPTHGIDMDEVEELVRDPDVVGMWCVPVFSNPQGFIYSDQTVSRLAAMKTANPAFKIMWDDAYTIHQFSGERPKILNILHECKKNGHEARPFMFTSFSKISIAGGGVACVAAAGENQAILRKRLGVQTIGPDKINQLRHARYFKDLKGIEAHMALHADILRPKFELAIDYFTEKLKGTDATFVAPRGGYFISVEIPNRARRVQQLCKEAGVLLTEAGATFPYNNEPADSNLRFAPSYLSLEELEQAVQVFCAAVRS